MAILSVQIDVFGAARQLSETGTVSVRIPQEGTVQDVLDAILALPEAQPAALQSVLKLAVLSTENDILLPQSPVPPDQRLALLPPVAGG